MDYLEIEKVIGREDHGFQRKSYCRRENFLAEMKP